MKSRSNNARGLVKLVSTLGYRDRIRIPLCLIVFVAGCTTIPENAILVIESTPSGANVISSEGWQCNTPCTRSVQRDTRINLKIEESGYQSVEQKVEIPDLKPSWIGTYVGAGIGVIAGIAAGDFVEAFTSFFLFGSDRIELSTGQKLKVAAYGALIYGGIGYAIDKLWDNARAKRPMRIEVTMDTQPVQLDSHEPVESGSKESRSE